MPRSGLLAPKSPFGVFADASSTGPAVAAGTTVSLLGLIVAGAGAHRLWQRFHSQYELS